MVANRRIEIRRLFLILAIFFATSCQAKPGLESDFLITGSAAGPIKIGDSKQQVLKLRQKYKLEEVDLFSEGMPGSPAVQIYDGDELLFNAEIVKGAVYRITVLSPRFKTHEGIGVGSTFGDLKKYFGKPKRLEAGEGGFYAGFDTKSGWLSFALAVPVALEEYVSDQTKIQFILVVGQT